MKPFIKHRPKRKGLLRKIVISVVILLSLGFVGFLAILPSLVMGPIINEHISFSTLYEPSDFDLDATELTLKTSDGYDISAFEVEALDPKAVLIFISGIQGPSVTAYYGHARVFKDEGYASILYDMRGHGKSSGDVICLGYLETKDTQAVVDYILTQERYKGVPIIVYGVSMGGAVAINSIGQIPELRGLVSISAYSSWEDVFEEQMLASGAPPFLTTMTKPFVKLYSLWKFGFETRDIYPKRQIQNLGTRPALLLHSTEDSQVGYGNFERIMERAPGHVQTWIRPGDEHFFTFDFLNPENDPEYVEGVLAFLNENF